MKIKIGRIQNLKKSDLLAFLYIGILCMNVASKVFSSSNLSKVFFWTPGGFEYYIIRLSIIGCICLIVSQNIMLRKKMILILIISIIVLISIFSVNTYTLASIGLFILAYPASLDDRKVAKIISYTYNICICYILVMYYLGEVDGTIGGRINSNITRYSYGFSSPNGFACMTLYALIAYIYYKREKWEIKHSLLWGTIVIGVYSVTDGRVTFVLSICSIIIMTVWCVKDRVSRESNSNIIFFVSTLMFSVGCLFSILSAYLYANGYFREHLEIINYASSYRLSFMAKYFQNPGISLWGQMIKTVSATQATITGQGWSGLDNSYLYMLILWGVVATSIYGILVTSLGKYFKQIGNKYGALCVMILCLEGIAEAYMLNVGINLLVIMIAKMVNTKGYIIKNKNRNLLGEI